MMAPQPHAAAHLIAHAERLLSQELDRLDALQAKPHFLCISRVLQWAWRPADFEAQLTCNAGLDVSGLLE